MGNGTSSRLDARIASNGAPDTVVGGEREILAKAPDLQKSGTRTDLSRLVAGSTEALGRDLSGAELRRIVNAGPLAEWGLDDPDVQEWLALLEFEYVEPASYNTVWDEFVNSRIDSVTAVMPEWLSPSIQIQFHADLDEECGESLAEAGWLWTVADSADGDNLDPIDPTEGDPCRAEGVHGFMFRMGDARAAIVRHSDVAANNSDAIEFLVGHPMREIALGTDAVALALALHDNT